MEGFLQRRANDPRFQNERRVTSGGGAWYFGEAAARTSVTRHTFSAANASSGGYEASPKMSDKKDGSPRKSRKLKRKKGSDEFTEAQKKELRNRDSSDGSDSGGCWSGYESVEGVPKGKKGSCKKRKKSD